MILFQFTVRIPFAIVAEIHQRVTHAAFCQATSGQTSLPVHGRCGIINPVQFLRLLRFFGNVQCFRDGLLHAKGELVGIDACLKLGIPGEWVVQSREAYLARACELAKDPASLHPFRACIRKRLQDSSFAAHGEVAATYERAFRALWQEWCEDRFPGREPWQPIA